MHQDIKISKLSSMIIRGLYSYFSIYLVVGHTYVLNFICFVYNSNHGSRIQKNLLTNFIKGFSVFQMQIVIGKQKLNQSSHLEFFVNYKMSQMNHR